MAFQAEQKIKADILRSLSTEQLFRLLSDSDLNVLMKTLGLLRNLLSTRPVSKITPVSRLISLAYTLQSTALPLCSHRHLPRSYGPRIAPCQRSQELMFRPVTFLGVLELLHHVASNPALPVLSPSWSYVLDGSLPLLLYSDLVCWPEWVFSSAYITYLWGLSCCPLRDSPVPSPSPH